MLFLTHPVPQNAGLFQKAGKYGVSLAVQSVQALTVRLQHAVAGITDLNERIGQRVPVQRAVAGDQVLVPWIPVVVLDVQRCGNNGAFPEHLGLETETVGVARVVTPAEPLRIYMIDQPGYDAGIAGGTPKQVLRQYHDVAPGRARGQRRARWLL